jgi:uroporphyrinogen III methyltransferase/synthase
MIEVARQGKIVVRLKAGDPMVFSRTAPETEALRAAGVPFEIVPGITAGGAAAGYAEIPITHADHASAVAFASAYAKDAAGGPPDPERTKGGLPLDYGRLADFPGTLVVYMGESSADNWSEALVRKGKSADTPVAIVRRCSFNDQQTIRCTLGTVAQVIAERGLRAPAVVVVGDVVSLGPEVSWFAARPLFGARVLITRPREQAAALRSRLAQRGAHVLSQPAIRISEPADWGPVDAALDRLARYDWLVFSSANGVGYLLDRLVATGGDLRRLGGVRLAAIGPGTAEALANYRLRTDLVPGEYRAEALAAALAGEAAGRRFLLARASRGRGVLAEEVRAAGGEVEQVVVYSSTDVHQPDPDVGAALAAGRIDWITVTSSAIARSLVRLFGDDLRRAKLASISPITSEALRALGHDPAVEAARYTMDGLVEAMVGSV